MTITPIGGTLRDGVYVCVPDDQHVGSFSEQWDRWATVQVDSKGYRCGYIGCANSANIFMQKTRLARILVHGKTVLDAGCGTGRFSEVAADFGARSVIGVDLSHAVFHAAKLLAGRGDHTFLQASLEELPLPDACVDVAFSIGVLHHTPHPERAVREIARVIKPGGVFAGWVYQRQPVYEHPLRKVWRDFSSDPANREAVLRLAMEAPRLRDLYDRENRPAEAQAEAMRILPHLIKLSALDPISFRAIVGISGSRLDDECRLDSFDWMTPKYQWQYTTDEWLEILRGNGFGEIRALQFPVSWQSRRI